MSVGKTAEFAKAILAYMVSGASLPAHSGTDGLYIGLLSGNPDSIDDEPFAASSLSAMEVSAGNFRAQITTAALGAITKDTLTSAMSVTNGTASVDFGSNAPTDFSLSGYVLTLSPTSLAASAYIGYEVFEGSTASKQRSVSNGDTIKINITNLVLKER